jgi:hypothetical protein
MKIHCKYDQLIAIDSLRAHPKNPNEHTTTQIERLAGILKYQGWRRPIRVSRQSTYITAGHGAVEAARLNGWDKVPVDFQDYDNSDQELADLVADNAIANWADIDLAFVNSEIVPELGPDIDIDMLGISDFEIEPADKESGAFDKDEGLGRIHLCPKCGHEWSD